MTSLSDQTLVPITARTDRSRSLLVFYVIAIGIWMFDFKAVTRGSGILVQGLILLSCLGASSVILVQALWLTLNCRPVIPLLLLGTYFLLFAVITGWVDHQMPWLLLTNCIPLTVLMLSCYSTYVVLTATKDRAFLLSALQSVCLAYVVCHVPIAIYLHGFDLSTSRYEFLSGASIPSLAVLATGAYVRFGWRGVAIATTNLAVILVSVTRTQLVACVAQFSILAAVAPNALFHSARFKRVLGLFSLVLVVLSIDLLLDTNLTTRWIERLTVSHTRGADPTALTRIAEGNFMWQQFTSSWEQFFFGNGLAAETSLIGPEAFQASLLVGQASVSIHSYGFGHNNHLSLLFVGGILAGMPLLALLVANGLSSIRLMWFLLRAESVDPTLVYLGVWGSLIVVGLLVIGFLSGTFEDRVVCVWYGVGTGMFLWARNEFSRLTHGHALSR